MPHNIQKYLTDIAIQLNHIDEFLEYNRDFEKYNSDLIVQYAVERSLGIIGEAANQVRKMQPAVLITSLNEIISLRHILIHAYDGINNAIIWSVIINHLPKLKVETEELLKESNTI